MSEERELRREPRFLRREAVHIQIVDPGGGRLPEHGIVHCVTEDVSATGFKVVTAAQVAVGRILELLIEVDGSGKRYLLVAEVRWCRPLPAGYACGFELLDAESSDLQHWRGLFAGN